MTAVILACNLSILEWSRELIVASLEKFELKNKNKQKKESGEEKEKKKKNSYLKGHVLRPINVYIINDVIKIYSFIISKFLL